MSWAKPKGPPLRAAVTARVTVGNLGRRRDKITKAPNSGSGPFLFSLL